MTETITVHISMIFRRRGDRKLIITPDFTSMASVPARPRIDDMLIKAIGRMFRWQKLLDEGEFSTIRELARSEKIDPSYVGDVLRVTLLAPDIIEMILDGRQPPMLQCETLRKSLPLAWEEQHRGNSRRRMTGCGGIAIKSCDQVPRPNIAFAVFCNAKWSKGLTITGSDFRFERMRTRRSPLWAPTSFDQETNSSFRSWSPR
jgi:hypothetical protein